MLDDEVARKTSEQSLEEAVEGLYEVFGRYPLHDHVVGCPCYVNAEDGARLHSKPLREFSSDDLSRYAFKAITTWGTEADFKHFLPRLFELVTDNHSITTEIDCEVLFGKLTYTRWRQWPQPEQSVIDRYFLALWRFLLATPPQFVTINSFLCGIAQAIDDLSPYLLMWQQSPSPLAVGHFCDCLSWNTPELENGRLVSAFWSGRPA